jgi:PAS domain S-box-containing protein
MVNSSEMKNKETELEKLERLAESFGNMGSITQMMRDSYSRLESKFEDLNSRLARVNELLRKSLAERNRLANYLNSILESLDSGVIVTDQSGIINIFNSTAERYTGIKAEAALGREYHDVMGRAASSEAKDLLGGRQASASGEREILLSDGSAVPVGYSITRLRRFDDGKIGGLVEILYDLTEIKRLEDNLKRISTLAALGEMAATVAHEIRNPIAGISGFASLLMRDLEPGDKNRISAEKIKSGVDSLETIVENLLDYTRTVSPDIQDAEPYRLVQEAVNDFQEEKIKESHSVTVECGSKSLVARLDPNLFKQIVLNLVKNAVQAQPDGGQIKLKLLSGSSSSLILKVEDKGPGIADDVFRKLFTPFFTTRTNGTGLGLATVKKLVELHGGQVTAANAPGGGAVFTVEIPCIEGGPNEAQNSHR